jgi:hypothetical protein
MEARYPETFENWTYLSPNIEWYPVMECPFLLMSGYRMVPKLDHFIIKKLIMTLFFIKWSSLVIIPDIKWPVIVTS